MKYHFVHCLGQNSYAEIGIATLLVEHRVFLFSGVGERIVNSFYYASHCKIWKQIYIFVC